AVLRLNVSQQIGDVAPIAGLGFKLHRAGQLAADEFEVQLADIGDLPVRRLAAGVVDQVEPSNASLHALEQLTAYGSFVLVRTNPQVVPGQGRLKNLLPLVLRRFITTQWLRSHAHDQSSLRRGAGEPRVSRTWLDGSQLRRLKIQEGLLEQLSDLLRA